MRGFAPMVVFWGEKHRRYFLEWLVPSLLAPGNLPSLINKDNSHFLIATTVEDWDTLNLDEVVKHIKVHWFPINPGQTIQVCGEAFARMTEWAWQRGLYGMLLVPDQILSNRTVMWLQRDAANGAELVLVPALRYSQEKFETFIGNERNVSCEVLEHAALRSFHPEMSNYDWDGPGRPSISSIYWRKLDKGVAICTASWQPILIDYAAIKSHNTSMLGPQHIDGGYIWANCKGLKTVWNPGGVFAASVTPEAEGPQPRSIPKPFSWLQEVFHRDTVRRTFNLPAFSKVDPEVLRPVIWGTASKTDFSIAQYLGQSPSFWLKVLDFLFDLPHFAKNRLFRRRQFGHA